MLARISRPHALFAAALFALYALIPSPWGTNQISRFEITKALALHGSVALPGIEKRTIDWAVRDGRYYSNKAPGSSMTAVPAVFLASLAERALGMEPDLLDEFHHKIADVISTALPAALLGWLLLSCLGELVPGEGRRRWGAVVAYALGSIAFPYSLSLWGHQTAAFFLFASFFCLTRRWLPALAGFCFAGAVLSEYSCAVAAPAFAALLLAKNPEERNARLLPALRFCVGGLPIFLVYAVYHQICFGAWYHFPQNFSNPDFLDKGGAAIGVLVLPKAGALYNLLFGLDRGLFVLSPVFLLLAPALWRWFRGSTHRIEGLACLWIGFAFWIFAGSFNGWWGGCCAGPRYLLPSFPFLAFFFAWVPQGILFQALLALSLVNMAGIATGEVHICVVKANLLWQQIYPLMLSPPLFWPRFVGIVLATLAVASFGFVLARKNEGGAAPTR